MVCGISVLLSCKKVVSSNNGEHTKFIKMIIYFGAR